MKLSEEIKNKIYEEYNSFKDKLYAKKSLKERKELDQFFTPPEITIQMIEKMDCDDLSNVDILDPCCGSGNLLVACLIAGADNRRLFGNDYDKKMVNLCRRRIISVNRKLGLPRFSHWEQHIHRGNAMQKLCLTEFSKTYLDNYNYRYIDDIEYAQGKYKLAKNVIDWDTENNEAHFRANPPEMVNLFDD